MDILETRRLLLRPFVLGDEAQLMASHSDPDVVRYLTIPPADLDALRWFVDFAITHEEAEVPTQWHRAVIRKSDQLMIGSCSVFVETGETNKHGMGFALRQDCWGHGYATELVHEQLRHAFNDLNSIRVYAETHPDNLASQRVLQKANLRCEGLFERKVYVKGDWWDVIRYVMLREEFTQRSEIGTAEI